MKIIIRKIIIFFILLLILSNIAYIYAQRDSRISSLSSFYLRERMPYSPDLFGTVEVFPKEVTVGEMVSQKFIYKAGAYGMFPGGRIMFAPQSSAPNIKRWSWPQVDDPREPGYITFQASRPGCEFEIIKVGEPRRILGGSEQISYFTQSGWYPRKFIPVIAVLKGERLRSGDTIVITYGDTSSGGPGVKVQDAALKDYRFYMWVDPMNEGEFYQLAMPVVDLKSREAVNLRVTASSTPKIGETFSITVKAEDKYFNAAENYTGTIRFASDFSGISIPSEYTFKIEDRGVHTFQGLRITRKDLYTIKVFDDKSDIKGESNPICCDFTESDLNIYFGDLHGHSWISDAYGTPETFISYGRDIAHLDFVCLSDHMPVAPYFQWKVLQTVNNEFCEPGRFVTIPGLERNTEGNVHRNAYYFSNEQEPVPIAEAPNHGEWFDKIKDNRDVMVIIHMQGREDPILFDDDIQPLIEVYSYWHNYLILGEREVNSYRERYPGTWKKALSDGYKLGVVGCGDNHLGQPGSPHNGITGVYTQELTRESIFRALQTKHCYATSGQRMLIKFEINGHIMGDEFTLSERPEIKAKVVGTAVLDRVELWKNNEIIYTKRGNGKKDIIINYSDYNSKKDVKRDFYYLQVYQIDGGLAWTSPIWINK